MSVRKTCTSRGCKYGDHRCASKEHSWESRLSVKGRRYSVLIDDYVRHRGNRPHVVTKTEAEKIEEEEIAKDWREGRDPRVPPPPVVAAEPDHTSLLVCMMGYRSWVLDEKLAEANHPAASSEMRHIVLYYGGDRPVIDLERVDVVRQFKKDLLAGWRPLLRRLKHEPEGNELGPGHGPQQKWLAGGREVVPVNRILQRQRHFMHWCQHQPKPLVTSTPFHEFGVTIDIADEEPRGRRLHDGEEAALYQAAREHNDWRHKFAGAAVERRITGALGLGARGSELDRLQVKHVNYQTWVVTLTKGKSKKARPIWVEEDDALREVLLKRRFLGLDGYIFGDDDGLPYEDRTAWETVVLRAHEIRTGEVVQTVEETDLQFRDLRRECASRWWERTRNIVAVSQWLGHSTLKMTQRYIGLADTDLGDLGMKRALGGGQK